MLYAYVYPAYTNYVPESLWQDMAKQFANRLANRDAAAPFRGSLIDENMFAIDTREWAMADILQQRRSQRIPRLPKRLQPKENSEQ